MSEGEEGRLWCVERRGECRFEWESEERMRGVSGDEKGVKDTNRQWCQHRVSIGAHCFDHNFLLQCPNSKVFLWKFSPFCALQSNAGGLCWFGYLWGAILKMLLGVFCIMSSGPSHVDLWGCLQRLTLECLHRHHMASMIPLDSSKLHESLDKMPPKVDSWVLT